MDNQILLEIASQLSDDQLDNECDMGHRTMRKIFITSSATIHHIIRNIEVWTDDLV